ncbi:MAG: hypothetical protein K6E12_02645 [Saccharofermentans sp.]|nr:hypothetical protein [Saccharofermentans sp.]
MIRLSFRPVEKDLGQLAIGMAKEEISKGRVILNPTPGLAVTALEDPALNRKRLSVLSTEAILTNTYDGVVLIDISDISDAFEEESMQQVIRWANRLKDSADVQILFDPELCRRKDQLIEYLSNEMDINIIEGGIAI